MRKAKILIVDDSAVIRRLLADALSNDPAIEVVGSASNGRIALEKIVQLKPDLITLDIEMPEMDGLATLTELRKGHPRLPVIMFSSLTQKGAIATLNSLSLGASDYVTKPANVGSVTAAIQAVRSELIPKIKALCRVGAPTVSPTRHAPLTHSRQLPGFRLQKFDCLAIGVSTGGPNALAEIFGNLPADFPLPIVIVQHMPPVFTKYLAERLSTVSPLPVHEAQTGDVLGPGAAWLAPGNFHMTLSGNSDLATIKLDQSEPEHSCRPAVDVLFRSVAAVYGPATLAVVLTGMGQDGLSGCEAVRKAGGRIVAQDEATSIVWGMPGAVVGAGLADEIVPLEQMAAELNMLARQRRFRAQQTLAASASA